MTTSNQQNDLPSTPAQPPLRGGVDLSSFSVPRAAPPAPGVAPREMVTEANLQHFLEQSNQVPVVLVLVSAASPASVQLADTVDVIVASYRGRLAFTVCDVEAEPQIAAALKVQAVPTVMALIGGRPAPLFQGTVDEAQIRGVLDQVIEVAAQAGVTGTTTAAQAEPEPEPIPPLHQRALDAIEAGNLEGAVVAYDQALKENPRDRDARAGRAQVALLIRTTTMDPATVRATAAEQPADVEAVMAVADIDLVGGHIDDAFARLIDLVRVTFGADRDRIRGRMIELFEVVGDDDPRVATARRALATALF